MCVVCVFQPDGFVAPRPTASRMQILYPSLSVWVLTSVLFFCRNLMLRWMRRFSWKNLCRPRKWRWPGLHDDCRPDTCIQVLWNRNHEKSRGIRSGNAEKIREPCTSFSCSNWVSARWFFKQRRCQGGNERCRPCVHEQCEIWTWPRFECFAWVTTSFDNLNSM